MSITRTTSNHNTNSSSRSLTSSSSHHLTTTSNDTTGSSFISNSFRRLRPNASRQPRPLIFSKWSSPSIPNGGWACEDFMVGVGMVIIQPSTNRMVVLYDHSNPGCFFLPRGRKDLGETLQEAVLREAYEESGFEVEFLPLYKIHRQPTPPAKRTDDWEPDNEPIYMTTRKWGPRVRTGKVVNSGGEYFVSWFVGQIPENPVHHKGVGMADEQGFQTFLWPFEEALNVINPEEKPVVEYAQYLYQEHFRWIDELAKLKAAEGKEAQEGPIEGEVKERTQRERSVSSSISGPGG